jgi:hypothetical protein
MDLVHFENRNHCRHLTFVEDLVLKTKKYAKSEMSVYGRSDKNVMIDIVSNWPFLPWYCPDVTSFACAMSEMPL